MSRELIYRDEAIKALGEEPPVWNDEYHEIAEREQWRSDVKAIEAVPSAQPDVPDKNVGELISRQDAIDVVTKYDFDFPQYMERFVTELRDAMKADLKHDIDRLPSAPLYTPDEIQTMQDLEWSQMEKMYELGKAGSNWISCKERVPESYADVLVWFEYYRYGSYNRLYQTYGIGTYSENYDSWTINHESGWHKLRVIAWQPLPESYKEMTE